MVAVALNLRPVMASVGPLLDQIESATGLDHTGASLMTTLPVCVMGLGALLAGQLQQRGRARLYVALGIASIALACGARVVLNTRYGLLATSLIAGIGIATIQTMLPGFIKRTWGARAGRVMGLYTTGIMGGAAFAAALSGPLADALGWSFALAVWALPAAIALPLWLGRVPSFAQRGPARVCSRRVGEPVWRRLRAWELMLFFGVGTGAYTLVLAWLPPFYTGLGWSSTHAGYLLGSVTVAEVAAGLCVSAWANRLPDRRRPLLFALAALTGGLVCLIVAPLPLAWLASALLGVGIGALFPLSLIVTLDHIDDPERAGELAAFVQGGGYLIASLAPLGAGALRDRFADLTDAWVLMAFGAALLALLCAQFSPRSYVEFGQ
jgi:CP family cyanate transporter-like MFS transporter